MKPRMPMPPGVDLTASLNAIALKHHISTSTAMEWKRRMGVPPNPRGHQKGSPRAVRYHPIYDTISDDEWSKGASHVGRLAGTTKQSAHWAGAARGKYKPWGRRTV